MIDWRSLALPERSALIVVDMQNDFCHPDGAAGRAGADVSGCQAIAPALDGLMASARAAGVAVVLIRTTHDPTTDSPSWVLARGERSRRVCRTGSWGCELYGIAAQPSDLVITKHRYSAFIGTDLEMRLRVCHRDVLFLTGVATNVCVESTLRDAFMLDFYTVLVGDCAASTHPGAHEATLANVTRHFGWTATSAEVAAAWQSAAGGPAEPRERAVAAGI